jgi:glycosyltransferase involved in cell wall biosynthesis
MRCPALNELPPAPVGKTGWPWTEESSPLPGKMDDGRYWPRLTVVTPSYNHGRFIEEAIRSVLLQGYPDLEYIIMDGGSTDDTVEIIHKYEPWVTYWGSQPDKGQADAINKGFARSSGEIIAWLNSDDVYEPESWRKIVRSLLKHPGYQIVHGEAWYIDEFGHRLRRCECIRATFTFRYLLNCSPIVQPTSFWYRALWKKVGPLRVDLNWGFDWEWYIRAARHTKIFFIQEHIANYRLHSQSKTQSRARQEERHAELVRISRHHGGWFQPTVIMYMAFKPSYHLERLLHRFKLPGFIRDFLMRAVQILPKLVGRVLKDSYQM